MNEPRLRIVFWDEAAKQIEAASEWWHVNRRGAPNAILEELLRALTLVSTRWRSIPRSSRPPRASSESIWPIPGCEEKALLTRLAATLRRVFPSVWVGQTDAGSFLLFAFTRVPSAERLSRRPSALQSNASVRDMPIRELAPPDGTPVFTDDLAPIEALTRRMLAGAAP